MNKKIICPSMMCANVETLKEEVKNLDDAGIDIYHIDIMDGHFVPNFGMGLQEIKAIRANTKNKLDAHLMITNPSDYIDLFVELGIDIIYIHPETDMHPIRTLQKITAEGCVAGIAINPNTSLEIIEELLPYVEYVMVMTVTPGFSGQVYLETVNTKIDKFITLKEKYGYKVMVDGAISIEKIAELSDNGVDGFIVGTSALFNRGIPYKTIMEQIRGDRIEDTQVCNNCE